MSHTRKAKPRKQLTKTHFAHSHTRREPSAHYNSLGHAKMPFDTMQQAWHFINYIDERTGERPRIYRCDTCDRFHIGGAPRKGKQ